MLNIYSTSTSIQVFKPINPTNLMIQMFVVPLYRAYIVKSVTDLT